MDPLYVVDMLFTVVSAPWAGGQLQLHRMIKQYTNITFTNDEKHKIIT